MVLNRGQDELVLDSSAWASSASFASWDALDIGRSGFELVLLYVDGMRDSLS